MAVECHFSQTTYARESLRVGILENTRKKDPCYDAANESNLGPVTKVMTT
jgi:hypothetical protein